MSRKVNTLNGYSFLSNPLLDLEKMNVYPVPNKGTFYIDTQGLNINTRYKINDIVGKQILMGHIKANSLHEVKVNTKGLIILQIINPKNNLVIRSQKLIVH